MFNFSVHQCLVYKNWTFLTDSMRYPITVFEFIIVFIWKKCFKELEFNNKILLLKPIKL